MVQVFKHEIILSFENNAQWTGHTQYFLPKAEIKDYNVMVDGQNFLNQPVKNDLGIYDNVRKITIGQGDDYTTGCLLDCPYFKENYKLIAKDLSKQRVLDADPKAIQKN